MSKKQFLKRQLLIINKLKQRPCSFVDLQKHLKNETQFDEENYEISIRTFQRDIAEIKSLFDIEIKFNRSESVYEIIDNQNQIHNERLLESFTILNTLKLAQQYDEEILFEQRKALGLENVFILIHAIKNQLEITFYHQKYWDKAENRKTVQPLVLKESKNRWYLVGLDTLLGEIRTFGLDRISSIEVTRTKFARPSKTQIQNLFQYSFGIILEKDKPEKISLRFSHFQANFIKALPLHPSQKIISEDNDFCVVELLIHPTYDFIMEILSMGKEVKVLQPTSLAEKIKKIIEETLEEYK